MLKKDCAEKLRLLKEVTLCLQRYQESVKTVAKTIGLDSEFQLAYSKSTELRETLRRSRESLNTHLTEHNC